MTTYTDRGSSAAVGVATAWTNTPNAYDGAIGVNNATYAVWTNSTSGGSAYIEVGGYDFASALPADMTSLDGVIVRLRHLVSNTARFASIQYQAYDGATPIGTPYNATITNSAHPDSGSIVATLAELKSANFKVRVTVTRAAVTQSATFSLDYIEVDAIYTPAAPTETGFPKVWSGSAWNGKPAKVWSGSVWATKPVKVWTGSAWQTVK